MRPAHARLWTACGGGGFTVEGAVRLKRVLVLPAVVVVQVCLGGIYAWSAFAAALRADYGLTAGQTQCVFGLAIAAFTLAMAVGGRWLGRLGARRQAMAGGFLFGAGHLVSACSGGDFARLLSGSGLLVGMGTGLGYGAALATATHWFPRHRGLVIGVAVAGFGAGAVVLSALASGLRHRGVPVLEIIGWIGAAYAGMVVLAGSLLFRAPPSEAEPSEWPDGREPRLDRTCRPLVAGLFVGTFGGLLVIGNLASMGMEGGLTLQAATMAIGFFAAGNAAGRVAWGWLSDRIGYRTIPLSLLFLACALVLLHAGRARPALFLAAAFLTGFGFGANFVVYAARVAARHGARGFAVLYPRIFLAYGVAGITGPPLGGYLHDATGHSSPAIVLVIVLLLLAAWKTASSLRGQAP